MISTQKLRSEFLIASRPKQGDDRRLALPARGGVLGSVKE
jgi:hypothetical protein